MSGRIPVIPCGFCTERISVPEEVLSFLLSLVDNCRCLRSYQQNFGHERYNQISLELKVRCQQCGRERIISDSDLETLSEVILAFRAYLAEKTPLGQRGQGVCC